MSKEQRARQRMLDKASEMATGTYCRRFVAPLFQKMIRAEAACEFGTSVAVVDGKIEIVGRCVGMCACITCGKIYPWQGTNMLDTGHFIASRRNSILLDEDNVAPQCKHCNRDHHGRPLEFRMWMEYVRGFEIIEELQALKTTSVTFSREDLVDLRISFRDRLKVAEAKMKGT